MKTKKEFLTNFASNPELAERTLNQGGLSWREIEEMRQDAYAADTGAIPGMIYYADTVPFAKDNHLLILQALNEFEKESGVLLEKPSPLEEEQYLNWLAFFAWENTMNEVLAYLNSKG